MADTFAIDQKTVEQLVLRAVQENILSVVENIPHDPAWLARIEDMINQTITYQTIVKISTTDINSIIYERVDAGIDRFVEKLRKEFVSTGMADLATENQLTLTDESAVFNNNVIAKNLETSGTAVVRDLTVLGSINTDNQSWYDLASAISDITLDKLTTDWREQLVAEVAEQIRNVGIDFTQVTVDGEKIINGNRLAASITESNIQTTGVLRNLRVSGEARVADTLKVVNKRIGINTEEPESALSIWDEEVAVNIGKNKLNQAYIGTSRAQGLSIGTNRISHIDIDADGMTQIKKLRIGVHQISHADQVPGWSGTRGDIVFNSNPKDDRVFAWVCLGNFRWQPLKSAE